MVCSYALCSGLGPLPELGWTGIAVGTAIGHCCGAAILLALLAGGRAGFHLRLAAMRPDFDLIRRILRIGIPGGIDVILVNICHMIYLRIVLSLGDVAAAAHGVAIQVEALGYMPGGAFQISAATMAGQYLGARDLVRARHSVIMACVVATAIMVVAGVDLLRGRDAAGRVLSWRPAERSRAAGRSVAADRRLCHGAARDRDGARRRTARRGRHPLAAGAEPVRHRVLSRAAGDYSAHHR